MSRLMVVFFFLFAACGSEVITEFPAKDMDELDIVHDASIDQDVQLDVTDRPDAEMDVEDMEADTVEPDPEPDPFTILPVCTIPLMDAFTLTRLAPPAAESNAYAIPSTNAVNTFEDAVRQVLNAQFPEAILTAESVSYTLCRGTGEYEDTVLFEPSQRGTGHAVLAIRLQKTDASRLIFHAPHILHDRNTLAQSVRFFEELGARVLLASGTHRCASAERGCSGTSAVCNRTDDGYAESDMAHSVQSYFQAAHEAVAESYTTDLVVSVHGMARAGVSISNGTRRPVATTSPVARVAKALVDAGIANVTACSPGTQVPEENFSADACFQNAATASERFLHLEQERALRDNPTQMVNALKIALAPEMVP